MSKTDKLKALVSERLKAAAEEICGLFEKTIKDYEEEVSRSMREIDRQRRLLCGWKVPPQLPPQEDPELPQFKEEQEDLWASKAGERLQRQEDTDSKDSMFNVIYVQRSDANERQSLHVNQSTENTEGDPVPSTSTEQMKVEQDTEGCDLSEATSGCQTSSNRSESEDSNSDEEWRDSGGPHSGSNPIKTQRSGTVAEKPYNCSICNKKFSIKSILTRHMKTHTGEKPYTCSVCNKGFIQRSYLQTHMNSHLGQKPYTCNFCGKGFTQVGNMNAHIRIHTGEKPHSCTDCGKSFREKADLIKHTIIHTGEKPYSCSTCNMKFSAQSNLTRHMKTHSGERPYSCGICGKRFIRRSHVNIHIKTHAVENL